MTRPAAVWLGDAHGFEDVDGALLAEERRTCDHWSPDGVDAYRRESERLARFARPHWTERGRGVAHRSSTGAELALAHPEVGADDAQTLGGLSGATPDS